MISLALGKFEVDWARFHGFRNHGLLFQENDRKSISSYSSFESPQNDDPVVRSCTGFRKSLSQILDRIELLGHTLTVAKKDYIEFNKLCNLPEEMMELDDIWGALLKVDLNEIDPSYSENNACATGDFGIFEILPRLGYSTDFLLRSRYNSYDYAIPLEDLSPYNILRILAENAVNLNLDVTWDFSHYVEVGETESSNIIPGVPENRRFLIVTEGSSDARIIEHAITIIYPHISDFFRFINTADGYPFSGSGNLLNFTKGLVSIGIQNQTVIVYDNDAEGVDKLKKTLDFGLPYNVQAMTLPRLDCFSRFVTEGPTGRHYSDINERAAAIECYLDLHATDLTEPVVRWTSFNKNSGAYQGELVCKSKYYKYFLKKVPPVEGYFLSKIKAVLDKLISKCVNIAEKRALDRWDS